jgi:hypothetical protein
VDKIVATKTLPSPINEDATTSPSPLRQAQGRPYPLPPGAREVEEIITLASASQERWKLGRDFFQNIFSPKTKKILNFIHWTWAGKKKHIRRVIGKVIDPFHGDSRPVQIKTGILALPMFEEKRRQGRATCEVKGLFIRKLTGEKEYLLLQVG